MGNQTIAVACEHCECEVGLEFKPLRGFGYWSTDVWFRCPSCTQVNSGLMLPGDPVRLVPAHSH